MDSIKSPLPEANSAASEQTPAAGVKFIIQFPPPPNHLRRIAVERRVFGRRRPAPEADDRTASRAANALKDRSAIAFPDARRMIEPLLIDRLPMTVFHFRPSPRLLTHAVAALARRALDFVYPPICLACDRAVADPDALCAACWSGMSFIEQPYCERLGTPFDQELGEGMLSPAAIAEPPDYGRARAAVRYEDETARRMVHGLKYGDRMELARPMARWMVRAGRPLLSEAEVIVPMPLHRSRLIRRRFNQAAELAREISAATDVPWDPFLLQRTKATTPQVGLTRAQRAINVRGAFAVREAAASRARGRRIVLVDDVLTSGASLNAAARALTRAGAATVDALVFARVVNEAGPTI